MRIYLAEDYKSMSRRAANIISAQVITSRTACWAWPPAAPRGAYQQLVEWYKKGDLSFSETRR